MGGPKPYDTRPHWSWQRGSGGAKEAQASREGGEGLSGLNGGRLRNPSMGWFSWEPSSMVASLGETGLSMAINLCLHGILPWANHDHSLSNSARSYTALFSSSQCYLE